MTSNTLNPEQMAKCEEAAEALFPDDPTLPAEFISGLQAAFIGGAAWSAAQPQWLPISEAPISKGRGHELNTVLVARFPAAGRHYPAALARKCKGKNWMLGSGQKLWFEPTHFQYLPTPPTQPSEPGAENAHGAQETTPERTQHSSGGEPND